jgi:hypothetical protein
MLSLPAIAQVQNGQIIGVITDPSGAATAGANIYFRNRDTGYEAHIESNDFGIYTARELIVGSYTIHVEVSGFKTIIATNLVVNAGMVLRVDFKLALGQRSETVEVRDAARLINTENSRLLIPVLLTALRDSYHQIRRSQENVNHTAPTGVPDRRSLWGL